MSEMALQLTVPVTRSLEGYPAQSGAGRSVAVPEFRPGVLEQRMCGPAQPRSRAALFCKEGLHPYIWVSSTFAATARAVAVPSLKNSAVWPLPTAAENKVPEKPSEFLPELY